ncbi:LolA family protein [Rosenbergiella epipactidis]|uniref:LolA family protein n=1 Tax=Rosenbergiella epipactidis TaxID=1544694 RepID=UPI001F4E7E1F|nr:outer membrane lipoprotein carrier protein LolA [Rosenbergiella epipactidis]
MKKLRWSLVMSYLLILPFTKAATLEQVQQQLTSHPLIRAHFEQKRTIKGMPQTLNSSGDMIISRTDGLLWQQKAPFAMRLVLKKESLLQQTENQPPQVITAQSNPQMFQFNHLLTALLTADKNTLNTNFKMTFTSLGNEMWQINLIPITTPLDKLFRTITINGGQFIEKVTLNDKQGDTTLITFSEHRLSPPQLTAKEHADFDTQ